MLHSFSERHHKSYKILSTVTCRDENQIVSFYSYYLWLHGSNSVLFYETDTLT